jgi:ankyrin repeat protein
MDETKVLWDILNDDPKADIFTGLRIACEHGYIAIVRFILMDNLLKDQEELTIECVKIAAISGHFNIVKVLLNNCSLKDDHLIRWAILNSYSQILEMIQIPSAHYNCVSLAIRYNKFDIVKILIKDLTSDQIQLLFMDACQNDNIKLVKLLIHQVDPSNCLNFAIRYGRTELVQVLLSDPRVIPSSQMLKGLKDISIVKMLLAYPNVDPSYENYFVIREAYNIKHPYLVKVYLDHFNKNKQDDFGICVKDDCEILQFKLSCGKFAICFKKILKEEPKINCWNNMNDGRIHILYPITPTLGMYAEVDEKYLCWQYRIGGDKWLSACKDF